MASISGATSSLYTQPNATTTISTTTTSVPAKNSTVVTPPKKSTSTVKVPSSGTGVAPSITQLEPTSAAVGTTITIYGTGFDSSTNYITFGTSQGWHRSNGLADNVIATEGSADGKTLTFTVPSSSASGMLCDVTNHCIEVSPARITPGNYPVTVKNKNGTSIISTFTVVVH